jgi:ferrochelatase
VPAPAHRRCYRAQCTATARSLAARLALAPEAWSLAFQSRLGRTPWIRPYTDEHLPELAARGVKRLAVLCPSFVADCLETLEEIGIRGRAKWRSLGGDDLLLVPSLNTHPSWVTALTALLRRAV